MFTRGFLFTLFLIFPIELVAHLQLTNNENITRDPLPFGERIKISSTFLQKGKVEEAIDTLQPC